MSRLRIFSLFSTPTDRLVSFSRYAVATMFRNIWYIRQPEVTGHGTEQQTDFMTMMNITALEQVMSRYAPHISTVSQMSDASRWDGRPAADTEGRLWHIYAAAEYGWQPLIILYGWLPGISKRATTASRLNSRRFRYYRIYFTVM
jgi:hypothetical protein